jgi:hypothetical protein
MNQELAGHTPYTKTTIRIQHHIFQVVHVPQDTTTLPSSINRIDQIPSNSNALARLKRIL